MNPARAMAEKKQTNKQTKKTCFFFFFFCPPLFFFLENPFFFFFFKKYSGVCYMHPNAQHQWEKKKDDFSLKILNPLHCTLGILKSKPSLEFTPTSFHPPPPDTHSAEQNCQGSQTSPSVGMLVKGVCITVINKNKQQQKNNLWILEKCHGKDLLQNVVYALKGKNKNKNKKKQKQKKKKTNNNNEIY